MNTSSLARTALRFLGRLALPLSLCAATVAGATDVDLADKPLFSTTSVPGNLLLDLSVEYPTANSAGYFSTTNYSNATTYLGYFDGAKCYVYKYGPDQAPALTAAQSYFQPVGAASSNHTCSAALNQWSGNYLNYATMQGLDIFRWVLTGGNRTVDATGSNAQTILQRATHSGQGGSGDAPNKTLGATDQGTATPIPSGFGAGLNTRVWGAGIQLWITNSADMSATTIPNCPSASSTTPAPSPCTIDYKDANLSTLDGTKIYGLYINVRVCDSSAAAGGLEANCVLYGTVSSATYKPEGLMQQYSQTLRYGAFGYLNDSDINRDGGVLRARMAYIAPTQPVPGAPAKTNAQPEWDPQTGVMYPNPDPSDVTDSNTYTGVTPSPAQSGVMNYLNKFGYSSGKYKTYDPVSELYYASIRYLKGLSNVSSYTTMGTATADKKATYVDGFPVISQWTVTAGDAYDPIVYSCQKNFILGIGDVNTHHDANLPGTTLPGQEPAMPPEVSADNTIDAGAGVAAATNTVGTMEGTDANLGSAYIADYATYYIAGLAYDAHVPIDGHGLRTFTDTSTTPSTVTISTASTYWLDVQEYQAYVKNNQYYYATKYGGFTVPNGYVYGTVPTLSSWYNSTNTQGGQKQPDNYYTASNATAMQAGLQSAFAKIAAENAGGNGTALAVPTPNVSNQGAFSYAATYDPLTWTGDVTGSNISFDTNGLPTLTPLWDAATLLNAATLLTPSPRIIVTCCTAPGGQGLPFTYAALSSTVLDTRTYYTSFANVPGVANPTSAQTAEANYIAYLRGDTSQEKANGGIYRNRASRLGDIVDSKPVTVGTPAYQFYDTYNPGYAAYKSSNASRKPVVYIASNDGMLHAFDGTAGTELFAYIPSFTYGTASTAATSGLASLGNPNFTHHYLVDGTVGEFDIDFNKTPTASGAPDWHTIIIGGLGKGGKGYYAIDVTDPKSFSDETSVAGKVLWEFTDSRLGYTYGTPSVVKTKKYGWVVVFTSGYTNADGMGYVFFVNPKTGRLLEYVSTPAGSGTTSTPLNLGQQSAYVQNYVDATADAIYAGDIQGNVWRVDVSSASSAPYPTAVKIAQFGSTQPITTRPLIEVPANGSTRYVLVGTGKLLGDSDIQSGAQQSFYAIIDGSSASGQFYGSPGHPLPGTVKFPITPAALNNISTSLLTGLGSNPTSAMGWYYNLPITAGIAERVNVDPFANQGIVAFIGNTPNGSACSPNGTGEVYGINFATGQTVLVNTDNSTLMTSQPLPVPTSGGTSGVGTDVTILSVGGNLGIYTGTSKGLTAKQNAILSNSGGVVLINWRDVPTTN